jgi:hypothetical protein
MMGVNDVEGDEVEAEGPSLESLPTLASVWGTADNSASEEGTIDRLSKNIGFGPGKGTAKGEVGLDVVDVARTARSEGGSFTFSSIIESSHARSSSADSSRGWEEYKYSEVYTKKKSEKLTYR